MVIILGTIKVASADEAVRLRDALAARATRSRGDAGNIDYAFSVNLEDPSEVRLTEIWTSEADLDAHLRLPDPAFAEVLATAAIVAAKITAYDGANERILMAR
ncbi:MAG: antibiotic biosynthesis monooxygenase [Gammaproteobacteria bacterium]|nr:antibiotic biosynthesis monooxygenase [Gammaproteobacteria bacterium]MCP5200841.1 antibiotic biosynthesis monooxygenase [Gammaproteobacteria bacterium]